MAWYEILLTFLFTSLLIGIVLYTFYLADKEQKRIKAKDEKILKSLDELVKNTKKDDE